MEPLGPLCQSCGMPMNRDEHGGGTESDGTRSTTYCSRCYNDGAFSVPEMTLPEMQLLVRGKLEQMQLPSAVIEGAVAGIPMLGRWKI